MVHAATPIASGTVGSSEVIAAPRATTKTPRAKAKPATEEHEVDERREPHRVGPGVSDGLAGVDPTDEDQLHDDQDGLRDESGQWDERDGIQAGRPATREAHAPELSCPQRERADDEPEQDESREPEHAASLAACGSGIHRARPPPVPE